jgi:ubiquinone/menaquinone biosynthesis C-methylase UbiE
MPDNHYENARLAELYDLDSPWGVDREFYLSLAGSPPQSVLDLGCGTGLLCNAYAAQGHEVTGVDPSSEMLAIARQKPHGQDIEWVQSSAQTYQSDKRFDLIIMTGHAFQVLLSDGDILAAFRVMKRHLKPSGQAVFESRNPAIEWARVWDYAMVLELPGYKVQESRRFLKMENGYMTFELAYQFPDETLFSTSELRFSSRESIEAYLAAADLQVEKLVGDWDAQSFDPTISLEMIFILRAVS